jgi:hypothetical protein
MVTRDLFSGDDEGFMDDAGLVRRLALEKLEQKAAELRSSWAWTRAMLDPAYDFSAQYRRVRPQPAELPCEITGEIERIEQRLAELDEISEDDWTDELMTEAARLDERRDELAESVENLAVYSEKDRATAGVIVTIGDDGEFRLHEGLVERSAIGAEDTGDETLGFKAHPDDEISRYSPSAEQALRKECGFSQLLVDDLIRTPLSEISRMLGLTPAAVTLPLFPPQAPPDKVAGLFHAATLLAQLLGQGRALDSRALRSTMEAAFGGTDAEGAWVWKDAYEALEAAQVLFLRKFGGAMRSRAGSPTAMLEMLIRLAGRLASQTRRSEESEHFQQFSTPLALGFVVAEAAALTPNDVVLEPSAGTGLLAIFVNLFHRKLDRIERELDSNEQAQRCGQAEQDGSEVKLHGGSPRGAERIAACWADHRKVPQVVFKPDWTRDRNAAPFKRNDRMLEALPIGVVVFPGSGIAANLADKAKKLGIPVAARNRNVADAQSRALSDAQSVRTSVTTNARYLRLSAGSVRRTRDRANPTHII